MKILCLSERAFTHIVCWLTKYQLLEIEHIFNTHLKTSLAKLHGILQFILPPALKLCVWCIALLKKLSLVNTFIGSRTELNSDLAQT